MDDKSITDSKLWAYVSKKADATTVEAVEEWMASEYFDETRWNEISEIYHSTGEVGVPQSQKDDAKARFFESVSEDTSPEKSRPNWLKYAAAVMVLVASSFWVYQNINTVTVETASGEQKQFTLPDGSKVWLNAASELSYSKNSPRKINLEGEAYFEVVKNLEKPFTVDTDYELQVVVLGTSFNVKAYRENGYMETILLTGKVAVNSKNHLDQPITMLPDDRIAYYPEKDSLAQSVVEAPENSIVWRDGEIRFDVMTLREIVQDLNVQYNANIKLDNDRMADSKFTGTFDSDTPVGEILETLSSTKSFEFERSENKGWLIK